MLKKICALLCALAVLLSAVFCYGAAKDIFSGKQDCLILGTVKDIGDSYITVGVDNTVGSQMPVLGGTDIEIDKFSYSYCTDHTTAEFNQPKIGDNIFASISVSGEKYIIENGAYKVDSSEMKNCSTIVYRDMKDEDCLKEAVEIAYFIRSNGKITKFTIEDDGKIYAINEDDKTLIYPLPGNQCVKFADDDGKIIENFEEDVMPIVSPEPHDAMHTDNRWVAAIAIMLGGAALGFAVFYLFYARRRV